MPSGSGFPDSDDLYSGGNGVDESGHLHNDGVEVEVDVDELAASLGLASTTTTGDGRQGQSRPLQPDGYFGRSDSGRSARAGPPNAYTHDTPYNTSSQVPHVPDRWVSDPSLDRESDKAREAREDAERQRHQNRRPFAAAADRQLNRSLNFTDHNAVHVAGTPSSSSAFSLLNPQPQSQQHHHHQPHPSPSTSPQHRPHSQQQPAPAVGTPTRDLHEDNNKYNNTHDFYSRGGPSSTLRASTRATATATATATAGAGPSSSSTSQRRFTPRYPASASTVFPSQQPANRPRRSPSAYSERSSLFSEAPPAYTPSPTSPTTAASTTLNTYQSISPRSPPSSSAASTSNMGRPSESEAQGLLVGQVYQEIPQSMGGDPDQHDENEFTYPRPTFRERLKRFSFRRQWKMVVLALVLLFLTFGFLVSSIKGIKNEKTIKTPSSGDGPDSSLPVSRPTPPQLDLDGTRLAYPPYDNPMTWDQRPMCGDSVVTYPLQTFDLEFSAARNISVFQDIKEVAERPANGKGVKVFGDIVVRRAAPGTAGPAIVLETITNDQSMQLGLDWDDQQQQLYIMTPLMMSWASTTISPCVQVRATIWAPSNSIIDSLNVEGVHLGVKLLDNLSLKLNNFARFASTVGTVVAATDGEKDLRALMVDPPPTSFSLDTRYVEVKTMSAAIAGSWPLCDYLGLETISGGITVGVRPKPALPDKPRPAILYARSTSGPIEVHEPIAEAAAMFAVSQSTTADGMSSTLSAETFVPPRQYGVDLYSMSGTVSGSVAFGNSVKVHTTSGHVTLTLLPVLDQAQAAAPERGSMVETSTTSGQTSITIMDALWTNMAVGMYVPAPVVAGSTPASTTVNNNNNNNNTPSSLPPSAPPSLSGESSLGPRAPSDLVVRSPSSDLSSSSSSSSALASRQQPQQQNPVLRVLSARHTATSANLFMTYPRSWEGFIDCDSLSGKIEVGGKDVQIIKQEKGLPGIKNHILAGKGDMTSVGAQVKVHTTSGKITVMVSE